MEEVEKRAIKRTYQARDVKVLLNNKDLKYLCVDFDGYGIKLLYTGDVNTDFVSVKYSGKLGTPSFKCELKQV